MKAGQWSYVGGFAVLLVAVLVALAVVLVAGCGAAVSGHR